MDTLTGLASEFDPRLRLRQTTTVQPFAGSPAGQLKRFAMTSYSKAVTMAICLALGAPLYAQAPAPAVPAAAAPTAPAATPASKPVSTSLGVVVFPAKGQTPQVQSQDEGECYAWSKGQTGVDPMAPAAAAPPPAQTAAQTPPPKDRSRAKGAARGAAAGAVIGEVADDDAGKGAAVGATVGAVSGGRDSRKNKEQAAQQAEQQQQQATQQQQAASKEQLDLFKKGFAACLEPKGYTVK
jgi:uncharacterized protein YcfJ